MMRDFLYFVVILMVSVITASFAPSVSVSNQNAKAADLTLPEIKSLRKDLDQVERRCAKLEAYLKREN